MNRVKASFGRGFYYVSERLRDTKTFYRRAKVLLILVFVALAIFQTSQLWFVHLSNRNFFLYLSARWNPSVGEGYMDFVRPMRSVYGDGTGRFDISYSGLVDLRPRGYFDMVLTELFDNGTFIGERDTDYKNLLSRPVLIFQYAFSMPGAIFPLGFNQRGGGFLTGRGITEFDSVTIWLPDGNHSDLRVFFIGGGRTWEFAVDSAGLEGFPVHSVSTSSLYFVSAALEGYDNLYPGIFIPRSGDLGRHAYPPVITTNPYHTQIGGPMTYIRNQVSPFFDNPATINDRVAGDGVWTFSNIHTAVRFFETDVLEYASFRPRSRNATSSLIGDFSAALAFIEADNHVVNEYFLTGFEPRGDGYVFWFGYIVDNFPIIMPDGWPVSSQDDILPAPIEVVVEQGRVVLYRRLAHNFHVYSTLVFLNQGDLDLEELLYGHEEPVLGINLGYHFTPDMGPDDRLPLTWRLAEVE
ncbi:MAG: hypothetical protein FWC73_05345 [Defluviitaleaceae bacterium]|nr:hypothetical protein [Defluviitaleaceae bacterium]